MADRISFSDLNLSTALLNALAAEGLQHPTAIQQKVFATVMSGADVCGIAQTGTGKTIAYLLPILRLWNYTKEKYASVLIIVPTRELVTQVASTIAMLTNTMEVSVAAVYGGVNINTQKIDLDRKIDIIVATPGRLYDLAIHGSIRLKHIKRVVIDEMDELLNLGFRPQLINILQLLPAKRQNLLFSATLLPEVEALMVDYFDNPTKIETAPSGTPLQNIDQFLFYVPNFFTKINLLHWLFANDESLKKVVVFAASKKMADLIFEHLPEMLKEKAAVIHSNKEQNLRFTTVANFENGNTPILIATDIIARGIDISDVTHVINFDIPPIPESYMHRIGRTGRATKKGISYSFATPAELTLVAQVEALMQQSITIIDLDAAVEISQVLTNDEMPKLQTKEIKLKSPVQDERGPAFHEKSAKNSKTNVVVRRKDRMMKKYGKPIKRRGKP